MLLGKLEAMLHELYALEVGYAVSDFLITDPELARRLDAGGRKIDEKLLIAEADGEADVALYLERELLDRLDRHDPLTKLDGDNLADFWSALEGVSHFTYYAWNAQLEKSVTLLEMELQAEVDKYVVTTLLLLRQGQRQPRGLHHWLFEMPRLDERLDAEELDRYRRANRYAGKYCRKLDPALAAADEGTRSELRRFYRLSQASKIEHIEQG